MHAITKDLSIFAGTRKEIGCSLVHACTIVSFETSVKLFHITILVYFTKESNLHLHSEVNIDSEHMPDYDSSEPL